MTWANIFKWPICRGICTTHKEQQNNSLVALLIDNCSVNVEVVCSAYYFCLKHPVYFTLDDVDLKGYLLTSALAQVTGTCPNSPPAMEFPSAHQIHTYDRWLSATARQCPNNTSYGIKSEFSAFWKTRRCKIYISTGVEIGITLQFNEVLILQFP